MTFYNHIESARYEMFRLVNGWTREGAETKARISESLDQARREYMQIESENAKLRELVRFIMHQCNDGNPRCDECIGWNDGECVALQRMREMGVEADG